MIMTHLERSLDYDQHETMCRGKGLCVKACSLIFRHFLGEFGSGCLTSSQTHRHEFGISCLEGKAVNALLIPKSLGPTVITKFMLMCL